ncbi:MAG: hypothetical protein GDA42_08810 [Ekhidna sp.]|nr:hypothetical protein [Ekhidna sp.]MBC6410541.1 hypothetical protein [Ekhidna sp.]
MKRRNFDRILLKTIPLIIGIIIAKVINNTQKRYADKQYLKITLNSIKALKKFDFLVPD